MRLNRSISFLAMVSVIANPGIALAEDLHKQSEADASLTPMDAARKNNLSDDHVFALQVK